MFDSASNSSFIILILIHMTNKNHDDNKIIHKGNLTKVSAE